MSNTLQRFWDKVEITPNCWNWDGTINNNKYGHFWNGNKSIGAHRFSYELCVDKIPNGLCIDHLCRNRGCVNPNHMEVVTNHENLLRGETGQHNQHVDKTHCIRGHKFTPENTYINLKGYRICKTCNHEWQKQNNSRKERK